MLPTVGENLYELMRKNKQQVRLTLTAHERDLWIIQLDEALACTEREWGRTSKHGGPLAYSSLSPAKIMSV